VSVMVIADTIIDSSITPTIIPMIASVTLSQIHNVVHLQSISTSLLYLSRFFWYLLSTK